MIEAGMAAGTFAPRPVERVLLGMYACFKGAITMLWAGEQWCPQGGDAATLSAAVKEFMLASLIGPSGTTLGNESAR